MVTLVTERSSDPGHPVLPFETETALHEAAIAPDPFAQWCLMFCLFSSIFLQRLCVPGASGIALNLLITVGVLVLLLLRGALLIDERRVFFLLCMFAAVMTSMAINAGSASIGSNILVIVVFTPYVLALRQPGRIFDACVSAYLTMMTACALFGLAQFALQFVMGPQHLFSFSGILPDAFLLTGYNTANPISWDSPYFKSNGFFFVEPSTYSQYLAVAVILELYFRGVTPRLFLFMLALPASLSGTGLLMLIVMLPTVLLLRRDYKAVMAIAAAAVLLIATGDLWHMDTFVGRASEFGSEDSSAYIRFFAGARLAREFQFDSPLAVMFGFGPGSFLEYARHVAYEAHDPPWIKILFEYGLVGSVLFWIFLAITFFGDVPSKVIGAALFIGYLTFGGMLLDPRMQVLILIFCVLPRAATAAKSLKTLVGPVSTDRGQAGMGRMAQP